MLIKGERCRLFFNGCNEQHVDLRGRKVQPLYTVCISFEKRKTFEEALHFPSQNPVYGIINLFRYI